MSDLTLRDLVSADDVSGSGLFLNAATEAPERQQFLALQMRTTWDRTAKWINFPWQGLPRAASQAVA